MPPDPPGWVARAEALAAAARPAGLPAAAVVAAGTALVPASGGLLARLVAG
jgi:hypothetical protein